MPRFHKHVHTLERFGGGQFVEQLRRSAVLAEKIRAAIIMQAWIDGLSVTEFMDEIVIERKENNHE